MKLRDSFSSTLLEFILESLKNIKPNNWDEQILGPVKNENKGTKKGFFGSKEERVTQTNLQYAIEEVQRIGDHFEGISKLYNLLEDYASKVTLVEVIAYRILSHKFVKLSFGNDTYWTNRKTANELKPISQKAWDGYFRLPLKQYDLHSIGYPIKMISYPPALVHTFSVEHYRYHTEAVDICAGPGDIIIDAGGAWGDTALYFSNLAGKDGRVYTFELDEKNLELFRENMNHNPDLKNSITLVNKALWSESGKSLNFNSLGPASKVSEKESSPDQPSIESVSIDDFIAAHEAKVDFIKMDIEGAELPALKGAEETLKRHKPKLAISLYHSYHDFAEIPKYLDSLNLGYKFYLSHVTTFDRETVLFAQAEH